MKPPKIHVVAKLFACPLCKVRANQQCVHPRRLRGIVETHEPRKVLAREQIRRFDMSPLRVECTTCGALPNEYCRDLTTGIELMRQIGWHFSRQNEAKALSDEQNGGSVAWSVRRTREASRERRDKMVMNLYPTQKGIQA